MSERLRVGVVGLGLVGGSLLRGVAREHDVRGYDADPATRDAVAAAGFAVAGSPAQIARWAEVVAVAVPPRATAGAVADALRAGAAAVLDVASVKAPIVETLRAELPAATLGRFVPAHPLAGSERRGWAASRAALLDDAVWAICPHDVTAPLEPLAAVARVLDAVHARLAFCTPEDHDDAVARSSHVPHVAANALARLAVHDPLTIVLAGGALRDQLRVAQADTELWADVLAANAGPVAATITRLVEGLTALQSELDDPVALRRSWEVGHAAARSLDPGTPRAPSEQESRGWAELLDYGRKGRLAHRLRLAGETVRYVSE